MTLKILIAGLCLAALPASNAWCDTAPTDRAELVFEIDEGMPGSLLVRDAADAEERRQRLETILTALRPLTGDYRVSLLVYPTHLYDVQGKTPRERVKRPLYELLEQLDRPENQDFGVYLEAYSSGIETNQRGNLASLPKAPIHTGASDPGRLGWAMDVETLAYLKDAFPTTFRGIRFHELAGSQAAWIATNGNRGFKPEDDVMEAAINLCAQSGLVLMWGESVWLCRASFQHPHYAHDPQDPPLFEAEPFAGWIRKASARLEDRFILNAANNNFHPGPSLGFWTGKVGPSRKEVIRQMPKWLRYEQHFQAFPLRDIGSSRWGASVQSWVWHELLYTLTGQYYPGGEMICPPSVVAVQAVDALRNGATVLQFEPSWYFFREATPGGHSRSFDDKCKADFSPRAALLELEDALLAYGRSKDVRAEMSDLYDADLQRLCENDETAVPRLPWACAAVIVPPQAEPLAIQAGPGVGTRLPFDSPWWKDEFNSIGRIELDGDGSDEFFGVRTESGTSEVSFFNPLGGVISNVALADPVGVSERVFAGNVLSNVTGVGDPDELIVAGRDAKGAVTCRIYSITRKAGDFVSVGLSRLEIGIEEKVAEAFGPGDGMPVMVRKVRAVRPDRTRPKDAASRIPTALLSGAWSLGDWTGDGHDELFTISSGGDLSIWSLDELSKPLAVHPTTSANGSAQLILLNRGLRWNTAH